VKSLFDEELLGRLFDTTLVLLDRAGTEFGHPSLKTNVRIFISNRNFCQGLKCAFEL
jgi:hypothetical protein